MGHLGLEQMLDLMCNHFFFPHTAAQVEEHIKKYHQCITFMAKQPRSPMKNIVVTHPLELVHLNYLCQEPGKGKEENVLVVMDHFTCYAQAYVTPSQMALATAKALWDNFDIHYVLPERSCQIRGGILRVSSYPISVG